MKKAVLAMLAGMMLVSNGFSVESYTVETVQDSVAVLETMGHLWVVDNNNDDYVSGTTLTGISFNGYTPADRRDDIILFLSADGNKITSSGIR